MLLELARGLAALWVFLFHAKELFANSIPVISQVAAYGSLGVPMFFVVSGYVITHSAESSIKNKRSPFVFLKNRFLRIYPTFWISIALILLLPYAIELISSIKSFNYTTPVNAASQLSLTEWINVLLLTKVFFATSDNLYLEFNLVNSVYWTLAIEFQFYLVIFAALLFEKYYRHLIAGISVASLFIMIAPIHLNHGLFIHYWPSFLVGIMLAYLHRGGFYFSRISQNKPSYIFALFISITLLLFSATYSGGDRFLFSCSFGLFLWVISNLEELLTRIKNSNNRLIYWALEPWLILGTMSYSVYLLHVKLYSLPHMFSRQLFDKNSLLYGLSTIVGTLLLCYLFYYFVESKFLSTSYKKIHDQLLRHAPN